MSSKLKFICFNIVILLIILLSLIMFLFPKVVLKINGGNEITIGVNHEYKELGAKAYLSNIVSNRKLKVNIKNNVNVSKLGKYNVVYEVYDKWGYQKATRIVNVVDNEKPVITVQNNINVCKNNKLVAVNAIATDNYDGVITDKINYKLTDEELIVSVTDSSDNKTEVKRKVKYIDNEKPIIELNGLNVVYLNVGDKYIDEGAVASDSCDGNLTEKIKVKNDIDFNLPGEYKIVYTVSDSVGNKTKLERKIVINNEEKIEKEYPIVNGATIYLTFDDGPFKYTEEILDILKKYGIKATFFVTNQFPKYNYVIKKEYEDGHSIGIHTYTHKWSIYNNLESYLDDFNKIDEVIYNQTGIHTKLFRFPGGSSNLVSRNYKKGIMTELASYMTSKGYKYFDWNVDSGDTNKKDSSTKAIIKNVKKSLKGDGEYVVLMHDIKKNTLEALPEIIEYALERGYKFSSLNEESPTMHFKIAN